MDVSWKNLKDLSVHDNKLLGANISNSFVGVWVVDLTASSRSTPVPIAGRGRRHARRRRGALAARAEEPAAAAVAASGASEPRASRAKSGSVAC